ncbi:MAG: HEAT repeat domain-containing protein [Candidatus Wallbacteria bacterium]|nr:HEAT repeat domain-containing protein [Candidatus Wallbacteria bacterium]
MDDASDAQVDWEPVKSALKAGDVVVALEGYEARVAGGAVAPQALSVEIAQAHVAQGNDLVRRSLWELALERYRRARKLDPASGEAAFRMGMAFRGAGATGAALACLREAQTLLAQLQHDPFCRHHLADAHFQEGLLLQEMGKLRPARAALRRALKVKPDYREVRHALDELLPKLPEATGGGSGVEREVLQGILDSLSAAQSERRREAVAALRDFPEYPDARTAALRLSEADPDPDVRFEARRTAGFLPRSQAPAVDLGTAGPAAALAASLAATDPGVRREALAAATRQTAPEMAAVVADHLKREDDSFALAQAVTLLAATGRREHAALLEPFLAHPSCRVVANAVEAIAHLAGELPLSLLLPLLESSDNRVRANALMTAVGARRPPVLDHLARMAASERESMRASALYCIERVEDPKVEAIAFEMLKRESAPELLWKVTTLLARVATQRLVPELEAMRDGDAARQGYAVYLLQAIAGR